MRLAALFLAAVMLLSAAGCEPPFAPEGNTGVRGCARCHELKPDPYHRFSCTGCHGGDQEGWTVREAHRGLISSPASSEYSKQVCGRCHEEEEASARRSAHYRLPGEMGVLYRAFFGPDAQVPTPEQMEARGNPETIKEVVEDALSRRCLRCHPYWQGDSYSKTSHGKGCASCHFFKDAVSEHRFASRTSQERCLSCHRQNFVGWDFVGRFEKDLPEDFRAPLKKGRHIERPFGVEWLPMRRDVHAKLGMECLDCHKRAPFHPDESAAAGSDLKRGCLSCHSAVAGKGAFHGRRLLKRVQCQSCHAAWQPLDVGTDLLRQDLPDLEEWEFLRVQGSSEVEQAVARGGPAIMEDKFSGGWYWGLWFKSFRFRRFEYVVLGQDGTGRLSVVRPILDIAVSYLDADDEPVLDRLRPAHAQGLSASKIFVFPASSKEYLPLPPPRYWLPYVPHTTGRADFQRTAFVLRWFSDVSSEK